MAGDGRCHEQLNHGAAQKQDQLDPWRQMKQRSDQRRQSAYSIPDGLQTHRHGFDYEKNHDHNGP